ncbi:DUF5709 domain-containing protein [Jatrophihabitans fulvus]
MTEPEDRDDLYEGVVVDASQLDPSETLTGSNTDDPLDAGYNPPDREPHSFRGDTAEETLEGESLDERLSEEEPDVSEADLDRADERERVGRLVAPDEGAHPDEEKDEIATDVGRAGYAASAEEAAMHAAEEAAPPADLDGPATV